MSITQLSTSCPWETHFTPSIKERRKLPGNISLSQVSPHCGTRPPSAAAKGEQAVIKVRLHPAGREVTYMDNPMS